MTLSTRLRSSDIWLQRLHTPGSTDSSRLISIRSIRSSFCSVETVRRSLYGKDADHLVVLVDNGKSSYPVLHHHMGCIADSLILAHGDERRAHDIFYMALLGFESLATTLQLISCSVTMPTGRLRLRTMQLPTSSWHILAAALATVEPQLIVVGL